MANSEIRQYRIKYDGLDADQQRVDMALLGESLVGISRILATSGNYVLTGKLVRRSDVLDVRTYAGLAQSGSYEIVAGIQWIFQTPVFYWLKAEVLDKAIEYIFSSAKRDSEAMERLENVFLEHIRDAGETNRKHIEESHETIRHMAALLHRPAQQAVGPIGRTCDRLEVGYVGESVPAVALNESDKERILAKPESKVLDARDYEVYVSEVDIVTQGCRVDFAPGGEDRIRGEIVDPVIQTAEDPYTHAMYSRKPLKVRAKAVLDQHGEIERLVISEGKFAA